MDMEERIARLIAVGSSVAANCQPCLASSLPKAAAAGADPQSIAQAIAIGRLVRQGAASHLDAFITSQAGLADELQELRAACDCSS